MSSSQHNQSDQENNPTAVADKTAIANNPTSNVMINNSSAIGVQSPTYIEENYLEDKLSNLCNDIRLLQDNNV